MNQKFVFKFACVFCHTLFNRYFSGRSSGSACRSKTLSASPDCLLTFSPPLAVFQCWLTSLESLSIYLWIKSHYTSPAVAAPAMQSHTVSRLVLGRWSWILLETWTRSIFDRAAPHISTLSVHWCLLWAHNFVAQFMLSALVLTWTPLRAVDSKSTQSLQKNWLSRAKAVGCVIR